MMTNLKLYAFIVLFFTLVSRYSLGGPTATAPATQPICTEHRIDKESVLEIKREDIDIATAEKWEESKALRRISRVAMSDAHIYTFTIRSAGKEREVANFRLTLHDHFFAGLTDRFELLDACIVEGQLALLIGFSGYGSAGLMVAKLDVKGSVNLPGTSDGYWILPQHNPERPACTGGTLKVIENGVIATVDAKTLAGRQFTTTDRFMLRDGKFVQERVQAK